MRDLPTAEKTPTPANGARGSDCAESDFFIGRVYSIAKIYNIMYSRPRAACGSGFFCAFLQVFCYIYNFKSVFFCTFNSICRNSAAPRQMCHADGTVIDKVSVFLPYNRCNIFRKHIPSYPQTSRYACILCCHLRSGILLGRCRQNENQPYLRIFVFQSYNGLCRDGIKTECTARSEKIADRSVLFSSVYRGRPCARKYAERRKTVNE